MEEKLQQAKRRAPVFSLLAIIPPFVGGCVGILTRQNDFGDFANFLGYICYGLLAGSLLAFIGIVRKEKPRTLSWCVLLIEAIPALYFITHAG